MVYAPWYDNSNIRFVMTKLNLSRDDAIDYLWIVCTKKVGWNGNPVSRYKKLRFT